MVSSNVDIFNVNTGDMIVTEKCNKFFKIIQIDSNININQIRSNYALLDLDTEKIIFIANEIYYLLEFAAEHFGIKDIIKPDVYREG